VDIQHQHIRAQGERSADRIAAGGDGGNDVDVLNEPSNADRPSRTTG
jgi:hypothetical protein